MVSHAAEGENQVSHKTKTKKRTLGKARLVCMVVAPLVHVHIRIVFLQFYLKIGKIVWWPLRTDDAMPFRCVCCDQGPSPIFVLGTGKCRSTQPREPLNTRQRHSENGIVLVSWYDDDKQKHLLFCAIQYEKLTDYPCCWTGCERCEQRCLDGIVEVENRVRVCSIFAWGFRCSW